MKKQTMDFNKWNISRLNIAFFLYFLNDKHFHALVTIYRYI